MRTVPQAPSEDEARIGARNQSLFREVNERIEELYASGMYVEFACECTSRYCAAPIVLSVEEYEAIRRFPTRFVVAPGHVLPTIERVVENNERYTIVEKTGPSGTLAVMLDPRRAAAKAKAAENGNGASDGQSAPTST